MPDDRKAHFYEEFAEDFDAKMNMYDLDRRIEIVFDELLPEDLTGKKLLDAGSGTGWFSERACKRGAEVTSFDFVICSEVIEHTVDPALAVSELARVLRPGGVLIITVPNRVWHFAIDIANLLKLRPYEGYENWLWWPELRRYVERQPLQIERMKGFHMIPFVVPATHGLLRRIDRFGEWLGPVMLNIAVRARKVATPS